MTKIIIIILLAILAPINTSANTQILKINSIGLNTQVVNASQSLSQASRLMDNNPVNQGSELCSDDHSYIAGHSSPTKRNQKAGRVFANLHKLEVGDLIQANDCQYEVREIRVLTGKANRNGITYTFDLEDWEYAVYNVFEGGTLTLQTCTKKLGQILIIKAVKI